MDPNSRDYEANIDIDVNSNSWFSWSAVSMINQLEVRDPFSAARRGHVPACVYMRVRVRGDLVCKHVHALECAFACVSACVWGCVSARTCLF